MTPLEFLSQFPNQSDFSRKSKILLFAYYLRRHQGTAEFMPPEIGACFRSALLRQPTDLSTLLGKLSQGRDSPLIRGRGQRYALSINGLKEVEAITPPEPSPEEGLSNFLKAAVPYLKKTVAKVQDERRREFLAEAIACLGVEARRATIVMTWLATVDHLYDYVLTHKLADFNSALSKRTDRLSNLSMASKDDFAEIQESKFIEVLRSARVITNDVRKILDEKLGTRNSCAHPSTIDVKDAKVMSFIEELVDNVISKYEI